MTTTTRTALLELHRALLESQRRQVERVGGRMTATELLQAATDDLKFSWLRRLSDVVASLDAARADDAPEAATAAALDRARALLDPPDEDTPFGRRYLAALQEDPAVVLAHRDVTAAMRATAPAVGAPTA